MRRGGPTGTRVGLKTDPNSSSSSVDLPPLPEDISDGPTVMSPGSPCSVGGASTTNDLRFHQLHGTNAVITNGGRTALRQNCRSEFNDAIVISNRWRDCIILLLCSRTGGGGYLA